MGLVGCGPTAPAAPVPPTNVVAPAAPHTLVGVVGQVGTVTCPTPDDVTWHDVAPTIGWTTLDGATATAATLVGQLAIARGEIVDRPAGVLDPRANRECGWQMRSDWRLSPTGIRVVRDGGPIGRHFVATSIEPWHGLTATLAGDQLAITFTNDLGGPLTNVQLVLHYESCGGKPMGSEWRHDVAQVEPGAVVRASAPAWGDAKDVHAYSVQLIAERQGVLVDLDAPVAVLGAAVDCRDR